MSTRGPRLVFLGKQGAGKGTQIRLAEEHLRAEGHDVLVTREPGGTELGEKIREVLLDPKTGKLDARSEALLFSAARAQTVSTVIRPALADKITIKFKVNPTTVDQNLMSGNITVDAAGTGLQTKTQPKVLTNPKEKARTDNSYAGATSYMALSTKVKPFDNPDCRKAVQYALDKSSVQAALGGDTKGDVASTLLPPTVNGYQKFDLYQTEGNKGDVTKAKAALADCGQPNGFTTNLTARSDRPDEVQMATAIQASLKKVGINAEIKQYPSGKYFSNFAGVPSYVHEHKLGMMMMAWGADWPTGFGFLDQIVNGSAIKPSGGNNLMELNDPGVNKALQDGIAETDAAARTKAWGEVDKLVMENASVVPLVYRKNLLYRPDNATNVTVTQAYLGMYDYLLIGSTT